MADNNRVVYLGTTDFRNQQTKFGIRAIDRTRHMYIIGKTGMGKSTVLENLAVQDIANGDGIVFVDPHGSAIEKLLDYVPEHRINDVIYFAPFDTDFPISFNVMEDMGPDKRHLIVNGLMASFKKIWQDAWSERMAYILTNTLLALLEYPGSTLLGVNRMYAEKAYREMIINNITDNSVKSFWLDEYNKWDVKYAREATAAIQNKIGQFTGNPLIRNIIGQQKSSFDFRRAMDEKKIILVNLSKGLIGEENMRLLGGMLITKLYLSAMSRADVGTYSLDTLPPCYFFVDEFQNFANESFADILAEARKYKLNLTVANQYIAQMEEAVRDAVFGNVGTTISFRVGPFDAEMLERAFMPIFTQEDLVNMERYQMYLTLSIDGSGSRPFSAKGLPPIQKPDISYKDAVIRASRSNYAQPRSVVEHTIAEWFTPFPVTAVESKDKKPIGASAPFNPNYKAPEKTQTDTASVPDLKKVFAPVVAAVKPAAAKVQSESSVVAPAPRPIPASVVKKNPPPVSSAEPKMSDTLKSLIDQIDTDIPAQRKMEKSAGPERSVSTPIPAQSHVAISEPASLQVKSVEKKPELYRAANQEHRQALRDLLKKVTPPPVSQPNIVVPVEQPVGIPAAFSAQVSESPVISAPESQPVSEVDSAPIRSAELSANYMPPKPKEVPEDILRRVLE